ncbi:MAG TPA: hypothetical protein VJ508_19565, partial [Saprospiraceae bacterium]|nr:hypothetical protein [Saprospiraceae bacterium]
TVTPSSQYTFSWSTGEAIEDLDSLAAGVYSVIVTDSSNCSTRDTFVVQSLTSNPVINDLISPANCGSADGAIDLTITPLTGNSFSWNNGAITEDLINITGGLYSVTVTDISGCTSTADFNVPDVTNNFTLQGITTNNISCLSPNGSVVIAVNPAATYYFQWSSGAVTSSLQNLMAGLYTVTVTDVNGCSLIQDYMISDSLVLPKISSSVSPEICGKRNGAIDLLVNGTTGNIFLWSNGFLGEDPGQLAAGYYTVTVTSENGCWDSITIHVPVLNSSFSLTGSTVNDTSCIDLTGSIDLNVSPGGNYSFLWSNGSNTEDLTLIAAGQYIVTVTDANQCSDTAQFSITHEVQPPVVVETILPDQCGSSNGSIHLEVSPPG